MNDYPTNRLWGGLPTEKNLALADRYPHFYANSDHILVISEERPDGLVEMNGKFEDALDAQDWRWILEQREALLREQEAKTGTTFEEVGNDFLNRFEAELKARREEIANGRGNRQENAE